MQTDLNILVISDIHAFNGSADDGNSPSYYSTWPQFQNSDLRNPFRTIPTILGQEGLSVDWILCPGDLADRADPVAQGIAWTALENLRKVLNAKHLFGTAGNHDIDSRLAYSEFDTKGALQSIIPTFPGLTEAQCDFFWSRNFAVVECPDVLLIILNSSAFHGINSDQKRANYMEFEHGRVSDRTIEAILKHLPSSSKVLNILLTHHHFYRNDRIFSTDYSTMINGTKLLDLLLQATSRPWFVLHGHLHYPEIAYGKGDGASHIIFSAGSFSRKLDELRQESSNQFYHIRFPLNRYQEIGWDACGICRAWDWVPEQGWKIARNVGRIPGRSGFGCRASQVHLATQIGNFVSARPSKVADWGEIASNTPNLEFLLPTDLDRVIARLQQQSLKVYGRPFLEPCQIVAES